ncbi:threonine/serine exporter family protein [Oceanobacillus sojae]|uniref:threonine/serine exporter family protein n=1 Tax=Oceanobacillus sojae TaxID=582851 RepID=UPI0021A7D21B|nr:threonine/serine exporter family protein [Oceanobacillus sojae]MCT1905344.1 threonine/serine exporter family protein [Oceanobacillus sojae]
MRKPSVTVEKICLLAGKIMLASGAETYRVEDTMDRIAKCYGIENPQSYATLTGLHFSLDYTSSSYFLRITKRATDLHKIDEVNQLSREIVAEQMPLSTAYDKLKALEKHVPTFSLSFQVLAAALVSGCFSLMFGGIWPDFLPACLAGGIGYLTMILFDKMIEIRFLAEFFGASFVGLIALSCFSLGFGGSLEMIIIGAVMPLVPGLPITNAIRDLMAGHLVSGVSKGIESLLTAVAIGAGIAIVYGFFPV